MRRKSRKKGPVVAKKTTFDGINFASGLEKYTYIALKKEKLFEKYEGEVFQLVEGFSFENEAYEKQANGKGDFTNRGQKKILGIKYTPDFTGKDYIIECKGRANESFPLRWKLFKLWLNKNKDGRTCYKPQNQKDVDMMIQMIKEKRKKQLPYIIKDANQKKMLKDTLEKTQSSAQENLKKSEDDMDFTLDSYHEERIKFHMKMLNYYLKEQKQ